MSRRHDAASSNRRRREAKCFRGVAQRDHRKVIAGVALPKVRRRSSKEDRASRDAAVRFLVLRNGGSLTVTSGGEL
jgi:hypothetical protein